MSSLELILSGATLVLTVLLGLLLSAYLPSYVKEKAKNLATKEDIATITEKVERVRADFLQQSALLEKKREVYGRISDSLRVFISGHQADRGAKDAFHSAYAACWLWGPDNVLATLNRFIQMQQENFAKPGTHSMEDIKQVYGELILAMRRDAGYPDTNVDYRSYQFVRFSTTVGPGRQ